MGLGRGWVQAHRITSHCRVVLDEAMIKKAAGAEDIAQVVRRFPKIARRPSPDIRGGQGAGSGGGRSAPMRVQWPTDHFLTHQSGLDQPKLLGDGAG